MDAVTMTAATFTVQSNAAGGGRSILPPPLPPLLSPFVPPGEVGGEVAAAPKGLPASPNAACVGGTAPP